MPLFTISSVFLLGFDFELKINLILNSKSIVGIFVHDFEFIFKK